MGHAPIATGVPEADNASIITFLRDPIKRVKSFCQHVSEGKSPYLEKAYAPDTFNLDQFLDSGNTELVNLQTKMLINTGDNASSALLNTMSPDEARERALANLFNRVSYFGLTEFFDASLMIFSQALAWSTPFYFSINRPDTAHLIEFKEHHLRRIAELNQIDIQVYNTAQAHLMTIVNSPQFDKAQLERFQSRNALLSPAMHLQYLVHTRAISIPQRLARTRSKTETPCP